MPESAYPIVGDELTDPLWRNLFTDHTGIVGDLDGTAYGITLSTNSDVATLGSTTQDSLAKVGGFGHRIDRIVTGATPVLGASVTVPPVTTGGTRTDVIALRYDPAYSGAPGPVRLVVIPGVPGSTALPVMDTTAPGVQHEPLWAITRTTGTALSQSVPRSLRRWMATSSFQPAGGTLPEQAPIGTHLTIGTSQSIRIVSASGSVSWHTIPNDVVERLTDLTRRTPHVGALWAGGGGYGPWYVADGAWNVAPGSAVKAAGCIKGHMYLVSASFTTTAAQQASAILARLGLMVGPARPTSRVPSNTSVLSQQSGVVSAMPGTSYEAAMPTTLVQRWQCPADGDYWFYPAFATNSPNGFALYNAFGSPFTEVTDLGPMTSGTPEQAP